MKILVIEDDELVRNMILLIAESAFPHARAEGVATGSDALASAARETPDLICLDLGLPDMSGFEVLQAMNAAGRRAPVVMITAEDLPDRRARAAQLGAEAFVPKPFEARKLRELLHSIVLESSRGQALGAFA